MQLYQIDPLNDTRWASLVVRHPRASIFHTVGWLKALRLSYGYEPVVYTTSAPTGELSNGIVFCRINSWITGRRLVSLPFSDHCELLCESKDELSFLVRYLQSACDHEEWKYLEIRPVTGDSCSPVSEMRFRPTAKYFLHTVDLRPTPTEVFRQFDRDSIQRRIRRAEKVGIEEQYGNSEEIQEAFYRLFILTRSRHQLPPIPRIWFRNLAKCLGNALEIRTAVHKGKTVAAILTLRFKDTVYYKYGCSEAQLNRLGATPWLLWKSMEGAKSTGATAFDLGRTEQSNAGLVRFKNQWVPNPCVLTYWNFPGDETNHASAGWKLRFAKRFFSLMPDRLLTVAGNLIYRHIG
jgi:hypothetical protein